MKRSIVKEHIIETASHLFYSNGYNLTGINEIIKEANIAKATLYNHFRSKDEVCIAYLQFKNNFFIESITAFILSKEEGKNRVLAIFDFLEQFYNGKEFNGCWCIRTVAELPKDNQLIKTEIQKQKKDFLKLIETTIEENIETDNTKVLAKQIYLLYEGAVSESHLHDASWPITEAKSICEKII